MKVGLYQGSVLNPLPFAVVMDVVSSVARSGLPSELLYLSPYDTNNRAAW